MLTQDFSKRGQALFFFNLKPSVVAVFEGVQPKDFITYYRRHDLDQLFQKWRLVHKQPILKPYVLLTGFIMFHSTDNNVGKSKINQWYR